MAQNALFAAGDGGVQGQRGGSLGGALFGNGAVLAAQLPCLDVMDVVNLAGDINRANLVHRVEPVAVALLLRICQWNPAMSQVPCSNAKRITFKRILEPALFLFSSMVASAL